MLMRTKNETLLELADDSLDSDSESKRRSAEWTRILDTAYEYEAACRQARTQSQAVQK